MKVKYKGEMFEIDEPKILEEYGELFDGGVKRLHEKLAQRLMFFSNQQTHDLEVARKNTNKILEVLGDYFCGIDIEMLNDVGVKFTIGDDACMHLYGYGAGMYDDYNYHSGIVLMCGGRSFSFASKTASLLKTWFDAAMGYDYSCKKLEEASKKGFQMEQVEKYMKYKVLFEEMAEDYDDPALRDKEAFKAYVRRLEDLPKEILGKKLMSKLTEKAKCVAAKKFLIGNEIIPKETRINVYPKELEKFKEELPKYLEKQRKRDERFVRLKEKEALKLGRLHVKMQKKEAKANKNASETKSLENK